MCAGGLKEEEASQLDINEQVRYVCMETPGRALWAKGTAQREVTVALSLGSHEFPAWSVVGPHSEERVRRAGGQPRPALPTPLGLPDDGTTRYPGKVGGLLLIPDGQFILQGGG